MMANHDHDLLLYCRACGTPVCPSCAVCTTCGHTLPVEDGILRCVDENDTFYEGAYQAQIHFSEKSLSTVRGRLLLPFITYGYLKAIVDHVPAGSRLLELGCGSGMQLAATRYKVTAVELSLASLRGAPEEYRHRIQGDVRQLDFLPGSFDAIAASCFWEHFTPEDKEALAAKFARWLTPGGVLILLFDTASENPWFRWLRRFPDLYQQRFIDHDGHVGLETVTDNRARFSRHGLGLVQGMGLNRTVQHLPVYVWMAPYADRSFWAGVAARFGDRVYKKPRLSQFFTGGLHLWDLTLGRAFPLNWSRLFLGVWRNPSR